MLTRRIISCLDVRHGRVVKGVRFAGLREVGDPVELAARHVAAGADELCFLNVSASIDNSALTLDLIRRISREVFIPFTVGGGVRGVPDARELLRAGADKVALNTAALQRPEVLTALADEFGSQCVVLSIDTDAVSVPVIASGGAGSPDHFVEVFSRTRASAALAASIFHDGSQTPGSLKGHLSRHGIEVRP
jgi:cyclase